ncbi:MAG: metal-dependent hydrolase [Nitratireductor sp.]|nr:metal-dependent hydrolase [Nitratireductor sp.]
MKITWYGHSAFGVEMGGAKILIDPFFFGPFADEAKKSSAIAGTTHVLLTHGHDDHIGDSLGICQQTGAMLVANFEICMYQVGNGLSDKQINPGNQGGTIDCGGFTTTFVRADHSSSKQTGGGNNIYLGNPSGLILHAAGEKTLYHMGDTDIFGDMALINELHNPDVGIVPIGDRFTMGGAVAALACRRYFNFETILPCHYGTFPVLEQSAEKFAAAMEGDADKVRVLEIGGSMEA